MLNAAKLTLIAPRRDVRRLLEDAGIVNVKEATIILLTPALEDKIAAAVANSVRPTPGRAAKTTARRPGARRPHPRRRSKSAPQS